MNKPTKQLGKVTMYALVSDQETACYETALCPDHFTRSGREYVLARVYADDIPDKQDWRDCSGNEALECQVCGVDKDGKRPEPEDYGEAVNQMTADMVESNKDEVIKMQREALARIRKAAGYGQVAIVLRICDAINEYHPMHLESWCGWPKGSEL